MASLPSVWEGGREGGRKGGREDMAVLPLAPRRREADKVERGREGKRRNEKGGGDGGKEGGREERPRGQS
jgi:hypothetical protein